MRPWTRRSWLMLGLVTATVFAGCSADDAAPTDAANDGAVSDYDAGESDATTSDRDASGDAGGADGAPLDGATTDDGGALDAATDAPSDAPADADAAIPCSGEGSACGLPSGNKGLCKSGFCSACTDFESPQCAAAYDGGPHFCYQGRCVAGTCTTSGQCSGGQACVDFNCKPCDARSGNTYVVDPALGNDTTAGSGMAGGTAAGECAWKTIKRAAQAIALAAGDAAPPVGTKIVLRGPVLASGTTGDTYPITLPQNVTLEGEGGGGAELPAGSIHGGLSILRIATTRGFRRPGEVAAEKRARWRVGLPRVLNMYSTGPFWTAYFRALGVDKRNVVWSDETSEAMWVAGGKYGSVDPCFPSKVVQAHVHQLLFEKHAERPLDAIFFPILTHVPSFVDGAMDQASCPIVAGTPEVIKAAFTKEQDFFAKRGIRYLDPAFSFTEPALMKRRLFAAFERELEITEDESDFAFAEGMKALAAFDADVERRGRAILDEVERTDRVAILVLGRPYHSDPGLNHGIPDEFQVLGYPILSIRSIPKDRDYLARFFADDLEKGLVKSPLEIGDVWPENYSANSAQRVWAAKFAARHPNVVLLDLSSFKCGHDAPTYGIVDGIVREAALPHAALHDLDANKPGGSITIRVKTYAHSLSLHEERLRDLRSKKDELSRRIEEKRLALLEERAKALAARLEHDARVDHELAETRERLRRFVPTKAPAVEPVMGLIKLGKKTAGGDVVRIP